MTGLNSCTMHLVLGQNDFFAGSRYHRHHTIVVAILEAGLYQIKWYHSDSAAVVKYKVIKYIRNEYLYITIILNGYHVIGQVTFLWNAITAFSHWCQQPYTLTFPLWWRHQMETFSALLVFCAGNSPITGEFPAQGLVKRSLDVSSDLRLNRNLSKRSWGWWFETP